MNILDQNVAVTGFRTLSLRVTSYTKVDTDVVGSLKNFKGYCKNVKNGRFNFNFELSLLQSDQIVLPLKILGNKFI